MAPLKDLHILPKLRDSMTYLYVEHCTVDREAKAISLHDKDGITSVPSAALTLLMLGPGTKVTHEAMTALADCGCMALWCGEQGVRFYASGTGETRSAKNLMKQAVLWSRTDTRLRVVRAMYAMRFGEPVDEKHSLEELRGKEGARMRNTYAKISTETGVEWSGRSYNRSDWSSADPVNRALSCANSCLYGLCHAAIVSLGYSPGLGFIHTGKQLSFVYDLADLYKAETTIPASFAAVAEGSVQLERSVRLNLRDRFRETRLLERIADDMNALFDMDPLEEDKVLLAFDEDMALPGNLWDEKGSVEGGVMYGMEDRQ